MLGAESLVASSVTVGRRHRGRSDLRLRATGPISVLRALASYSRRIPGGRRSMDWVSSRARSATHGMQPCFM